MAGSNKTTRVDTTELRELAKCSSCGNNPCTKIPNSGMHVSYIMYGKGCPDHTKTFINDQQVSIDMSAQTKTHRAGPKTVGPSGVKFLELTKRGGKTQKLHAIVATDAEADSLTTQLTAEGKKVSILKKKADIGVYTIEE